MKDDRTDDEFAARLGDALRWRAEQLDGHTRAQLARARREALARAGRRAGVPLWVPAGASAAALALAVGIWSGAPAPPSGSGVPQLTDDMDLLLSEESLELLEELEFYAWMDALDADLG